MYCNTLLKRLLNVGYNFKIYLKIITLISLAIFTFLILSQSSVNLGRSSGEYFFDSVPGWQREKAIQWILENRNSSRVDITYLKLLRDYILVAPSILAYNLSDPSDHKKQWYKRGVPSWIFINSVLKDLANEMKPGFFVEAGAFDGEFLSNSLVLEKDFRWSGLLIEPAKSHFRSLSQKHRKSWIANVAMATGPLPTEVTLMKDSHNNMINTVQKNPVEHLETNSDSWGFKTYETIVSIPITDLLRALNVTKIDVFSLDVEGAEELILESFPFERIDVDVWVIEHISPKIRRTSGKTKLEYTGRETTVEENLVDYKFVEWMEGKGYYLMDVLCDSIADFVFVRIQSEIFKHLKVPEDKLKNRGFCYRKGMVDYKSNNPEAFTPQQTRDKQHWPKLPYNQIHVL